MKKVLLLSTLASLVLASDSFLSALDADHTYERKKPKSQGIETTYGWLVLGDFRAGYLRYDYSNPPPAEDTINKGHTDSKGFYITPKLSIMSPKYSGFSFKATVAGATDFGLNDEKYEARNFVFDPDERKSFILLQELYLSYETKKHKLLLGREELATPMIDTDDWYMLANSFEVAYYAYTGKEKFVFAGGYFYKMAGVWDSGANGTEFHTMAEASFVDAADKKRASNGGIPTVALLYNDNKHHNLQLWNYYAIDLYNTFFAQYDYTDENDYFSYDVGFQIIDFQEVGELKKHNTTNINYTLYSARFDGNFHNGLNFATGIAKYTDGEGQGATLGAWGGYPYFANGMIFHFFEAGSLQNAASYKLQGGYDLTHIGLKHSAVFYRFTYFDLDPHYSLSSLGEPQEKMALQGVRYSYSNPKNGGYLTVTYEHVDLDFEPTTYALRVIGGVKF